MDTVLSILNFDARGTQSQQKIKKYLIIYYVNMYTSMYVCMYMHMHAFMCAYGFRIPDNWHNRQAEEAK